MSGSPRSVMPAGPSSTHTALGWLAGSESSPAIKHCSGMGRMGRVAWRREVSSVSKSPEARCMSARNGGMACSSCAADADPGDMPSFLAADICVDVVRALYSDKACSTRAVRLRAGILRLELCERLCGLKYTHARNHSAHSSHTIQHAKPCHLAHSTNSTMVTASAFTLGEIWPKERTAQADARRAVYINNFSKRSNRAATSRPTNRILCSMLIETVSGLTAGKRWPGNIHANAPQQWR